MAARCRLVIHVWSKPYIPSLRSSSQQYLAYEGELDLVTYNVQASFEKYALQEHVKGLVKPKFRSNINSVRFFAYDPVNDMLDMTTEYSGTFQLPGAALVKHICATLE